MHLIKTSEQEGNCGQCRHYYKSQPDERFPYGCQAMKYVGKQPPGRIVLNAADGACPLFTPIKRPAQ